MKLNTTIGENSVFIFSISGVVYKSCGQFCDSLLVVCNLLNFQFILLRVRMNPVMSFQTGKTGERFAAPLTVIRPVTRVSPCVTS